MNVSRRGLFGLLFGGVVASFAPKTKPATKPSFRFVDDPTTKLTAYHGCSDLRFIDTTRRR